MTLPEDAPRIIVRALPPSGIEGDGKTVFGRIARANEWSEINSSLEGHFLERNAPGAFRKTFTENRDRIHILFQHGKDPQLGDKPIAVPTELDEDSVGAYYRGELLDGVPPLIVDGLRRGVYGSSHRFEVVREDWERSPKRSDYNPKGLPERTIREAQVFELGPVTWPAYAGSSAGVRSLTDEFMAGRLTPPSEPDAPSLDAEATPHLEPERREDPAPPPVEVALSEAPAVCRSSTVSEYITRDEKSARVVDLRDQMARVNVEYPGVLPDPIQAQWDADDAEIRALERDIAAWDARQARLAEFASDPAKVEATYSPPAVIRKTTIEDIYDIGKIRNETRSRDEYNDKVRDHAKRSLDSSRLPRNANVDALVDLVESRDRGEDGEGEMARRILLTGSPAYRRAFDKYLRGEKDLWSPEESRAAALAVTGTTTTGGYAVPYIFDPTLLHIGVYTAQNPFRSACRVETISNGNNWRTVTVGAVTSAYVTEAAAATEQGPDFGQPSYTVQRAHAFATVSHETLQDRPDIGSELTSVFAESKATYEENQFAIGAGTTVFPLGMFTNAAYTNVDTATNDVTAIGDILVLEGALPLRHRANGAFFMNRSTIRQLQTLDTTYRYFSGAGIQYAGQSNPTRAESGNTSLTLLGYPVWEVPSAVSTLTTDGAIIAVFCDPKSYVIVDRLGMGVEVIPNMLNGATPSFPTGQRGIYMYWRNTAKPINADAGRSLSVQ